MAEEETERLERDRLLMRRADDDSLALRRIDQRELERVESVRELEKATAKRKVAAFEQGEADKAAAAERATERKRWQAMKREAAIAEFEAKKALHKRAKEEAVRIEALREAVAKAKADAVEAAAAEEAARVAKIRARVEARQREIDDAKRAQAERVTIARIDAKRAGRATAGRLDAGAFRLVEGELYYLDDAGDEAEFDYAELPRASRPPHHQFSPRHRAAESEILAGLLGKHITEFGKQQPPKPGT